jgi:riboflavin kinase / FMN adenylyltransferase
VTPPAVADGLDEVEPMPSVVTIGNFDGVHRGHQVLLHRVVDAALARRVRSVAVTFEPHPAAVLRPGSEPPTLGSVEERAQLLLDTGMDLVVVLPFTHELSELSPEGFVAHVLAERLTAVRVVVGTNFRFGHRAQGDVIVLTDLGSAYGFDVEAVAVRDLDGEPISSTMIRQALGVGEVAWAARALGRTYTLRGEVIRGDGRGRGIGVPTANLAVPEDRVVPAHGVYAGHAQVGDTLWPCVTNVGVRPTFGTENTPSVEAHLIDVEDDLDLYGRTMTIGFEHRLRGEQRFDSVDALVTRIRADIQEARTWLRSRAGREHG